MKLNVFLYLGIAHLQGSFSLAKPGDAAVCLTNCQTDRLVCNSKCPPGSQLCLRQCMKKSQGCQTACPGAPNALEEKIVALTNAERFKLRLPSVVWDVRLGAAAQGHAENMAYQQKAEHVLDGRDPGDRISEEKYSASRYTENVYWGFGAEAITPEAAVKWWMNSPGHRANILDPKVSNIGVGIRTGADGKVYFGENFGAP